MSNRRLIKRNSYYGIKYGWVLKGTIANTQGRKTFWVPKT